MEILVVLLVLGALTFLMFGVFNRSKAAAYQAQCDSHLKAIALALDAYKQEHGYFPAELQELQAGKYLLDPNILRCPNDPRPDGSYNEYYAVRGPHDSDELPVLVCPFHESTKRGVQAYVGRYTSQFMVSPAHLTSAVAVTVERPGEDPVAAPVGLELHGADRLRTAGSGFATVVFADGSEATMEHDADMTLLQSFVEGQTQGLLYTLLHQTAGTVSYKVHHGSKFDVVTPTATAGALGTEFEIRVNAASGSWLSVNAGKVSLTTLAGGVTTTSSTWTVAPVPTPPPPGPTPPRGPGPRPGPGPGPPPPR